MMSVPGASFPSSHAALYYVRTATVMIRPSWKYQTEIKRRQQLSAIFTADNCLMIHLAVAVSVLRGWFSLMIPFAVEGETLTCAGVAVGGRSGAAVSLSCQMAQVQRLDDERLLVVRQSVDAAPGSQPPGHTGEVGPLAKNTGRNIFKLRKNSFKTWPWVSSVPVNSPERREILLFSLLFFAGSTLSQLHLCDVIEGTPTTKRLHFTAASSSAKLISFCSALHQRKVANNIFEGIVSPLWCHTGCSHPSDSSSRLVTLNKGLISPGSTALWTPCFCLTEYFQWISFTSTCCKHTAKLSFSQTVELWNGYWRIHCVILICWTPDSRVKRREWRWNLEAAHGHNLKLLVS